jgi:hypothetical protein
MSQTKSGRALEHRYYLRGIIWRPIKPIVAEIPEKFGSKNLSSTSQEAP